MLFQRWSNGGERITDPGTRQGFWVFSPGGAVLGRCNTRSPERVLAVLDAALERWEALPAEERGLDPAADRRPGHRWEDGYPEGGLALARVSRDVTADGLEADPSNRWNRDTLWCSAAEVAGTLRRPDLAVGDALDLQVLADRLARFSLVDDARGQTLPYAPAEVQLARLTGEVVAAGPGGSLVVELAGETRAVASEEWLLGDDSWRPRRRFPHGIRCRVVGRAEVDPEAGTFRSMELVAVGTRTGRTTFNGRGRDLGPSHLGFHLTLTDERLAPTFAALYGVDWIPTPEIPTWRDRPEESGLTRR